MKIKFGRYNLHLNKLIVFRFDFDLWQRLDFFLSQPLYHIHLGIPKLGFFCTDTDIGYKKKRSFKV